MKVGEEIIMPIPDGKPYLEVKEPRFISLICAVGGLLAALFCLLSAIVLTTH